MYKLLFTFTMLFISLNSYAKHSNDFMMFQHIFSTWTEAFNNRDLFQSCALFSKSVVADYQGVTQKNYTAICDGFKKVFQNNNIQYEYKFKLREVYRSNDLAAIRVTWYLRLYKHGHLMSNTRDEGIDILKLKNGEWKIVNYIAYQKP